MRSQSRPTGRAQTKVRSYGTHVNEREPNVTQRGSGFRQARYHASGPNSATRVALK